MPYYAVKKGRREGVFTNWNDCLEQVKGYSGADYKKFNTEAEARVYAGMLTGTLVEDFFNIPSIEDDKWTPPEIGLGGNKQPITTHTNTRDLVPLDAKCMFYVDGSYNIKTGVVGYGVVGVIDNGEFIKIIVKDFGSSTPVEDTSSRNVLGEIKGAIKATELAIANGYKKITICYDYEGVEKWATNQWKAKNPLTQYYKSVMSERMKLVEVEFKKIKAHSGDQWNDEADRLAKIGAGV